MSSRRFLATAIASSRRSPERTSPRSGLGLRSDPMSEVQSQPRQVHRSYPHTVTLSDGRQVQLRLMMPGIDVYRLHAFASSLPKDDLQFLRVDITRLVVVIQWAQNIKAGLTVTVLAEENGEVVGYASVHNDQVSWPVSYTHLTLPTSDLV